MKISLKLKGERQTGNWKKKSINPLNKAKKTKKKTIKLEQETVKLVQNLKN